MQSIIIKFQEKIIIYFSAPCYGPHEFPFTGWVGGGGGGGGGVCGGWGVWTRGGQGRFTVVKLAERWKPKKSPPSLLTAPLYLYNIIVYRQLQG